MEIKFKDLNGWLKFVVIAVPVNIGIGIYNFVKIEQIINWMSTMTDWVEAVGDWMVVVADLFEIIV